VSGGGKSPGPEAPGWTQAPASPAATQPHLGLTGLAPWIFWLLLVLAVTYTISTVATLLTYGLGEYEVTARLGSFSAAQIALSALGFVQGLLSIAVTVLFIIWFYRAYRNLRRLGAPGPRRSVGWTIGAWFVPILDLILPKLMLNEIWRGSDPETSDPTRVRIPAFHTLWWSVWVAAFVLAIAAGIDSSVASVNAALSGEDPVATGSGAVAVLNSLLYAVAATLGALVVRRTTERQERRWRRLASSAPAAW